MTDDRPRGTRLRRHRRLRVWSVVALAVLLLSGAVTARTFIWPDLPPVPPRVDAIVELGGAAVHGRGLLALQLARAHRAPYLVQSTIVEDAGTHRCLPPVDDVTVLCFHADPGTTRGEAEAIGRLAEQYHWKSVVLVTTPDQAWRARLRTSRCFPGPVYVATSPLPAIQFLWEVPYQAAASVKALTWERAC
jgi:uncharacterized SAM-binding protein YcdF (DUF218 family)